MNVPRIRFKGFDGEWEKKQFGELSSNYKYGINAAAMPYDGINRYLRITDIDEELRIFLDQDLTSPDTNLSLCDDYLLREGDLTFARTGASVGKSYIYHSKDGKVYFAGFLIRMRLNANIDSDCVFYSTLTNAFSKYISITSQRSGQPGVNVEELKAFKFHFPYINEQRTIASYLMSLDSQILASNTQLAALKQIKSACLQSMFPQEGETVPKVRFKGFEGEWEEKRLGDIAERYDNLRIPIKESIRVKGSTPYYGANGIQDYVDGYTHDGEYVLVAEDGANDLDNYPVIYVVGKIWVNNHAHVLQAIKNYSTAFFKYRLQCSNIKSVIVGGSRAKLNASQLMNINILFPSFAEQLSIASYFTNLDRQITLHTQCLEKLKQIKAACLEKMFV